MTREEAGKLVTQETIRISTEDPSTAHSDSLSRVVAINVALEAWELGLRDGEDRFAQEVMSLQILLANEREAAEKQAVAGLERQEEIKRLRSTANELGHVIAKWETRFDSLLKIQTRGDRDD